MQNLNSVCSYAPTSKALPWQKISIFWNSFVFLFRNFLIKYSWNKHFPMSLQELRLHMQNALIFVHNPENFLHCRKLYLFFSSSCLPPVLPHDFSIFLRIFFQLPHTFICWSWGEKQTVFFLANKLLQFFILTDKPLFFFPNSRKRLFFLFFNFTLLFPHIQYVAIMCHSTLSAIRSEKKSVSFFCWKE